MTAVGIASSHCEGVTGFAVFWALHVHRFVVFDADQDAHGGLVFREAEGGIANAWRGKTALVYKY